MPRIDKTDTLDILRTLDSYLEDYEKKFPIYLMGGSALILREKQADTKDADFITNANGFLALSSAVLRLEREMGITIDVFREGYIINYRYPDYYLRSDKVLSLKHLEVYVLDYVDIILTKALAGRDKDRDMISKLKEDGIIAPKEELERRFKRVIPHIGKEQEIKERFENFLKVYYAS